MKQVISSLSKEFTTVAEVDSRKFYGVKFGNAEQTFPKLLLVHQDYFNVLRFDGGVYVGGVSFLLDKKFTQLKPTIDFLLQNGYGVYEFSSFAEWNLWYSGALKLDAPAPVLKPLKKRKMSFRKNTKSHLKIEVTIYHSTGEYIAHRRGINGNKSIWLTRSGIWQKTEMPPGDGLEKHFLFPTKEAVEAALDKLERQK